MLFMIGAINSPTAPAQDAKTAAASPSSSPVPSEPITPTKQVIQPKKPIATPTPKDPCADYVGTSQMGDCMKLQDAMDKGQALQHPLKASVTFDNSAVYITNNEQVEWDQCTATLDEQDPSADNYQSDGFSLNAGQTQTIRWMDFTNAESTRFDYFQTKPQTVTLDCQVGGQTDPKTGAFSGGAEHRSIFNL